MCAFVCEHSQRFIAFFIGCEEMGPTIPIFRSVFYLCVVGVVLTVEPIMAVTILAQVICASTKQGTHSACWATILLSFLVEY